MTKKLKVIWICHFVNEEVTKRLDINKKTSEMAPWITLGILEAKKRTDIELHIVSPYPWILNDRKYSDKNIHYHFYRSGIPLYGRHWPQIFRFDILTNFFSNKKKVKNIVEEIKPDIIHLHGFENAYYSSSIFQFINRYPIIATVQGFISLQETSKRITLELKKRLSVEREIIQAVENFGVRTEHMQVEINKINKEAKFYWHEYFINYGKKDTIVFKEPKNKKYDLIFFARIAKEKGIEDLIIAVGKLIKWFPKIQLAVVGSCVKSYAEKLKQLAMENKCEANICFLGFQANQNDVYKILDEAKISVLPTYNDIIPGTIIESMIHKIPVVAYATGGIPSINRFEENIKIAKKGDITDLVDKIRMLLTDVNLQLELANRSSVYAEERWDNSKTMDDIINIYNNIVENDHDFQHTTIAK